MAVDELEVLKEEEIALFSGRELEGDEVEEVGEGIGSTFLGKAA